MHFCAPGDAEKRPGVQLKHAPAADVCPAAQSLQAVAAAALEPLPAGQVLQLAWPLAGWNWEAGQGAQAGAPALAAK